MKAPDKIYIRTGMSGLLYGSKEKSFETDAEYIRKDALLEWAKEQYREYANNPFYVGERDAFTQLIKKLNTL